jgi:ATP-dependent protease ClpP protease subunit
MASGENREGSQAEGLISKLFSVSKTKKEEPTENEQSKEKKDSSWKLSRKPVLNVKDARKKRQEERKLLRQKKLLHDKKDDRGDDILYTSSEKGLENKNRQQERKQQQLKSREEKQKTLDEKKRAREKEKENRRTGEEKPAMKGPRTLSAPPSNAGSTTRSSQAKAEDAEVDDSEETNGAGSVKGSQENDETQVATVATVVRSESSASKTTNASGPNKPTLIVMGSSPPPGAPNMYTTAQAAQKPMMQPNQALAATAIASLVSVVARLCIVVWITKRLASEEEAMDPVQHFVWECLNDRYAKDDAILTKTLAKPPSGISQRKWNKYIKSTRSKKITLPDISPKTVVVVDITPNMQLDMDYLSDVVTFLVGSHTKQKFGVNPEVVLLLGSPGGEVTLYGLAAAHVARLEQTGIHVTVCIDNVAASGGYMIASQASQIVAAPFAMVGSIGVIKEGLNFNKLLSDYGIKPLVIKAGEMKNPLSSLGPVTDNDIRRESERLKKVHDAFIELCLKKRPCLDPTVCDGTVMVGGQAISFGMIDRVLTSDDYLWEKIREGCLALKLHKSTRGIDRGRIFARALDLLPHLRQRISNQDIGGLMNRIVQGVAFMSMVHRALCGIF